MQVKIFVVVLTGAGDDDRIRPQILQHGADRDGGTAGAQNQHLFAGNIDFCSQNHGTETEIIRIIASELSVTLDDGVDGAQSGSQGVYLV